MNNLPSNDKDKDKVMRTIADAYIEEGYNKGLVQGIEQGRGEGIQAGIETKFNYFL